MPEQPGVLEPEQERQDRALGLAIREWAAAIDDISVSIRGPLDAPGMDPRWILGLRSRDLEAEVCLFYGPFADIAAFRPPDPSSGLFVGGETAFTAARFIEMLNDLVVAARGGPMPGWLRSSES